MPAVNAVGLPYLNPAYYRICRVYKLRNHILVFEGFMENSIDHICTEPDLLSAKVNRLVSLDINLFLREEQNLFHNIPDNRILRWQWIYLRPPW